MAKIGLILGYNTSLDKEFERIETLERSTPYGAPSDVIQHFTANGTDIYTISRHGIKGNIPSFMVNYKANIFALYELGCTQIISTSVCGSLQEEIDLGEFVIFDQFIDVSTHKELTFIDKIALDELNHSAFNKPFSDDIRDCLIHSLIVSGNTVHTKGTVIAVDGPRQSTRAESNLYRSWNGDVVNTSTVPEAILSHELNMQYGAVSLVTYFDTWRTDIHPATRAEKLEVLSANEENFKRVIKDCIKNLTDEEE